MTENGFIEQADIVWKFPELSRVCDFPSEGLHPYSYGLLEGMVGHMIHPLFFERWFHMPDSSYYELGQCILNWWL